MYYIFAKGCNLRGLLVTMIYSGKTGFLCKYEIVWDYILLYNPNTFLFKCANKKLQWNLDLVTVAI